MKPKTKSEAVTAGPDTDGYGKRRYANRAFTALSGCEAGKFTGSYRIAARFFRLFPHKSTQVVDFPRIANVRLFWEGVENSRISGRGMFGKGMGPKWENRGEPQRRRDAEASEACIQGGEAEII